MLVLLVGGIYEVRSWNGLRCRDIRTKFHKDWLMEGGLHTQIHRKQDDLMSLLLFFQNRESRLKLKFTIRICTGLQIPAIMPGYLGTWMWNDYQGRCNSPCKRNGVRGGIFHTHLHVLFFAFSLIHSWSWAHLEKLPNVRPLKKFPAFYGTRRFITVFTKALHWSLCFLLNEKLIWFASSILIPLATRHSLIILSSMLCSPDTDEVVK
jgi:hypothetical protein